MENDNNKLYDFEILAQIQHYGGATCLVDFTKNFFTALWFATNVNSKYQNSNTTINGDRRNGMIYIIDIEQDSNILGFITPKIIEEKTIEQILKIEITGEEYKTIPQNRQRFWIWEPKILNNRIYSQDSIFFFGLPTFENRDGEPPFYYKMVIEDEDKSTIQKELSDFFNINASTIYSDLQGFAGEANNSREKADYLLNYKDCLATAKHFNKRREFDFANNYLNQATNCLNKNSTVCSRNVIDCSRISMNSNKFKSEIAFQKASCNRGNKNTLYKALAFYLEAYEIDKNNYEACYELMRINYDLKNYKEATKYAEIYIARDESILFDLVELNLILGDQTLFNKFTKKIQENDKLFVDMGVVLLSLFELTYNVIHENINFKYSEELNSLLELQCDSYKPYWLFNDLKDWLTIIGNETNAIKLKENINNLLLIIERIEDKQKELINRIYEKDEF